MTLTEMIEQLQEWKLDINSDLTSDWIDDKDRNEMTIQLQFILTSLANLELLHETGDQIFASSITR